MKALNAEIIGLSPVKEFTKKDTNNTYKRASLFVKFDSSNVIGSACAQVDIFSDFDKYCVTDKIYIVYDNSHYRYQILDINI